MDVLPTYRQIIRDLIRHYSQFQPARGDVQIEVVFDESNDHYELNIDIRNDKVWIQHDGTEAGIADELVEAGIPRDRIVLAFKHPKIRLPTDFAVA